METNIIAHFFKYNFKMTYKLKEMEKKEELFKEFEQQFINVA